MAEELRGLIEKIQEEGVRAAEKRAADIEKEAASRAELIVKNAKKEAEGLVMEAKDRIAKMEQSSRDSLKQAGRDLLLMLKKEINNMLDRIIASHVHKALEHEELAKLISALLKGCRDREKEDVLISLRKEDLERLEGSLLSELKDETKKGITLQPSEEIHGGFIISFDKGKSYYDFTDEALAEYIVRYLKPRLSEILNG